VLVPPATTEASAAGNPAPSVHPSHGITVTDTDVIDDRQVEYTVQTDTLDHRVRLRVVMPSDYQPGERYPVLYLYHGTGGAPSNWPDAGDLLETTQGLD